MVGRRWANLDCFCCAVSLVVLCLLRGLLLLLLLYERFVLYIRWHEATDHCYGEYSEVFRKLTIHCKFHRRALARCLGGVKRGVKAGLQSLPVGLVGLSVSRRWQMYTHVITDGLLPGGQRQSALARWNAGSSSAMPGEVGLRRRPPARRRLTAGAERGSGRSRSGLSRPTNAGVRQ